MTAAGFTRVDKKMNVWFEWGFILILITMVGILLAVVATLSKNNILTKISAIIMFCGNFLGGFIWSLTGFAIRWNTPADICSNVNNMAHASWESVPLNPR